MDISLVGIVGAPYTREQDGDIKRLAPAARNHAMDRGETVDLSSLGSSRYFGSSKQQLKSDNGDDLEYSVHHVVRTAPESQTSLLPAHSRSSSRINTAVRAAIVRPASGILQRRLLWRGLAAPARPAGFFRRPRWWRSWFSMYLCFALGVACAVGHHAFYQSLDGRVADSQTQMLRYGTLLAFAAKAWLSAAVVQAFRQRVWAAVRTRFMAVAAVDALFAAAEDLTAFLSLDLFRGSGTAAALAAFVWLAPLMVILTANTLLVELRTVSVAGPCPGVRTLNFSLEEVTDWRRPTKIDGLYGIPLSLWNTTKPLDDSTEGGGDWFDYYTEPSPNFQQTATLSAFMSQVVERKNASVDSCGAGWNCTFHVAFTAPGYKCTELASGVGSQPANLTQQSGVAVPPFGTDVLLPRGSYAYYAHATGGEYATTQLADLGLGGVPNTPPPYPPHMGAIRTEPVIWVGYVALADPDQEPPIDQSDPRWDSAFVPKMFACEHYEAAYTARFAYADGAQTARVTNRTFLGPVVNTTYVPGVSAADGTADNVTASPEANYVLPGGDGVGRYRRVAAYHSLGYMLRTFINGTVSVEKSLVNPIAATDAIQTRLLDPRNNYFPHSDLMGLVQTMYEDMVLSLMSNPSFVEVVWAARPAEQSGAGATPDPSILYPCTRTRTANTYSYHARDLWIVYGIAVLLGLLCVVAGRLALGANGGVARDTRFSSVVAATRGPALDRIVPCDGAERGDISSGASRTRIGYGLIRDEPDFSSSALSPSWKSAGVRYGFGPEGDVRQQGEGPLLRL